MPNWSLSNMTKRGGNHGSLQHNNLVNYIEMFFTKCVKYNLVKWNTFDIQLIRWSSSFSYKNQETEKQMERENRSFFFKMKNHIAKSMTTKLKRFRKTTHSTISIILNV